MLYIGKNASGQPYLIDPSILRTHGLCVGMTGSGKTGFCTTLLEELRLSGIPTIIIDPKGDMGNLALSFSDLSAESFLPWIDSGAAAREGMTPLEYAGRTAERWRQGLEKDGIGPDKIDEMNRACPVEIFTPGSTAGRPLNLLSALEKPGTDDPEVESELIRTAVAALLALVDVKSDPLTGKEFILLSNLLDYCWEQGISPNLERLIAYIFNPPIKRLGVFAIDKFYPEAQRQALAMKFNALVANPFFETWTLGEGISVPSLTRTQSGGPRLAVVHLGRLRQNEREFVIALLLSRILEWTLRQPGTEELRLLVYLDEVAGMMPPHPYNPPTKAPLLTLFKQARAFGVGIFAATQNPVDLDYKVMGNAGFWAVGKLNTEGDRRRIVEGLKGWGDPTDDPAALITGLEKRQFLIRNIHDPEVRVIASRFAMSYLRGPMTKADMLQLRGDAPVVEKSPEPKPAIETLLEPPVLENAENLFLDSAALRVSPWRELFSGQPPKPGAPPTYRPAIFLSAQVRFDDTRAGVIADQTVSRLLFPLDQYPPDQSDIRREPLPDMSPYLSRQPMPGAAFLPVPDWIDQSAEVQGAERNFIEDCRVDVTLPLFYQPDLALHSLPGQTREQFDQRLNEEIKIQSRRELEKHQSKFLIRIQRLEDQRRRVENRLEDAQADASARSTETAMTVLETAAGFLFGRRRSVGRAVSGTMRRHRMADRASRKAEGYQDELMELEDKIEQLQDEMAQVEQEVMEKYDGFADRIQDYIVPLEKSDIRLLRTLLIWVPDF